MSFELPTSPFELPFEPPLPERLHPPVHVDGEGLVVPDPRAVLGLSASETDPAAIRAAWREALLAQPPEQFPEEARVAREARDRLIDDARFLERQLGVLSVPDADAWGLPELAADHPPPASLTMEDRLLGQALLYALLESEMWDHGLSAMVDSWANGH